jgi:hypothetical protein
MGKSGTPSILSYSKCLYLKKYNFITIPSNMNNFPGKPAKEISDYFVLNLLKKVY